MTDNQLLALREEDPDTAFTQLYEKYFDRVLRYSYRRTFDAQIAYDIAANVFIQIAEKFNSFTPKHENAFVGWLFKIANGEVVAYYRKPEKYKSSVGLADYIVAEEMETIESTESDALDTAALYKQLNTEMRKLNVKEQSVIDLYYFEDMSYKQIAHSTGMKESNVGVTLHRAVKKLQHQLTPIIGGDLV